ncbi:hypothetical protein ACO1O0_006878 [Amphichorda felina]
MPKFTFPIPGRSKKQPPPVVPSEPRSKAQRVLGSTHFAAETPRAWDNGSNSGISVSVSESTAPTTNSSSRGYVHGQRGEMEWADESGVSPRNLRSNGSDEVRSERRSILREKASTSTIKSWYDKTRHPLSVTQQTSASAIAKGPPPKAQRLLDMGNAHSAPAPVPVPATKSKKKPTKLDLSQTKQGTRSNDNDWDGPMLGNDYVVRSPSIVSPVSTASGKRPRRKIQKRPTHESLRRQGIDDGGWQPETSGNQSANSGNRLDELPSLYKHYEQMSFAQVMNDDDEMVKEAPRTESDIRKPGVRLSNVREETASSVDYDSHPKRQVVDRSSGRSSHPTVASPSSRSSYSTQKSHTTHLSHPGQTSMPHVFHPPLPTKLEPQSPVDYATSISSRHTRTSKASKRTEKSIQAADLQEKSVLMLSSDSEEEEEDVGDAYTETSSRKSVSTASAHRRPSLTATNAPPIPDATNLQAPIPSDAEIQRSRQSNLAPKHMSSAPAGFLTIPSRFSSQTTSPSMSPSQSPSSSLANIQEGSQLDQGLQLSASPSDVSLSTTNSSASTAMTWQGREGYGVQEARAVAMFSAQGPRPHLEQDSADSDLEYDEPALVVRRESSIPAPLNAAEPTPPVSPRAGDSHMHSPGSRNSVHEHIMGLTRREQMLIEALREKRGTMRKNRAPKPEEEDSSQLQPQPTRKGHRSNPSDVTITESTFNFGFPAPPTNKDIGPKSTRRDSSRSPSMIDLPIPGAKGDDAEGGRLPARTADGTVFVLSPPPSSHHKSPKSAPRKLSGPEQTGLGSRRSHAPPPLHPATSPAPSLSQILQQQTTTDSEKPSPPRGTNSRDSLPMPKSNGPVNYQQHSNLERHESKSRRDIRLPARDNRYQNWCIMEDEPSPLPPPPGHQQRRSNSDEDAGIPRPDSPISISPIANAFPSVPGKRKNQSARLSAFGPPQGFAEFQWLGDDD